MTTNQIPYRRPHSVATRSALLALILALIYIGFMLEDFVIPLMYRHSITTTQAWGKFLALHRTSGGYFFLYAFWKVILALVALVCIVAAGLLTCCVGFVLMIIPYIGSVLLLPVSVFFRFLGPEFLRQFGSEYDILQGELQTPRATQ